MDLYPLYNSVRIALISTVIIFFAGTAAAYYISRLPRAVKGFLDVILTIPLVLPPTVIGYLLLRGLGPHRLFGEFFMNTFDIRLTMTWWSTVIATSVVSFPLMYRSCRGAFESFDTNIADAARTLGHGGTFIFWRLMLPVCRSVIRDCNCGMACFGLEIKHVGKRSFRRKIGIAGNKSFLICLNTADHVGFFLYCLRTVNK